MVTTLIIKSSFPPSSGGCSRVFLQGSFLFIQAASTHIYSNISNPVQSASFSSLSLYWLILLIFAAFNHCLWRLIAIPDPSNFTYTLQMIPRSLRSQPMYWLYGFNNMMFSRLLQIYFFPSFCRGSYVLPPDDGFWMSKLEHNYHGVFFTQQMGENPPISSHYCSPFKKTHIKRKYPQHSYRSWHTTIIVLHWEETHLFF